MTPTNSDREAARERARLAREARAGRGRTIRRRVISGAVALFVATWLLIAIVLISGHDPALSKQTASVASSSSSPSTVSSSSGDGSGSTASASNTDTSSSTQGTSAGSTASSGSGSIVTRSS